jgi:hypothetical protein
MPSAKVSRMTGAKTARKRDEAAESLGPPRQHAAEPNLVQELVRGRYGILSEVCVHDPTQESLIWNNILAP